MPDGHKIGCQKMDENHHHHFLSEEIVQDLAHVRRENLLEHLSTSDDDDDEPNDAKLNKDHFGGYIFIKSKPLSKKSYDSLPMWKANILLQRSVGRVAAFVDRGPLVR